MPIHVADNPAAGTRSIDTEVEHIANINCKNTHQKKRTYQADPTGTGYDQTYRNQQFAYRYEPG
jgi:hypothetical protein